MSSRRGLAWLASLAARPLGGLASLPRPITRTAVTAPWRGWTGVVALLGIAYAAAYLVAYILRPGGDTGALILSDFGEVPLEAFGIVLVLAVASRETRQRTRLAWWLIGLALGSNAIGNIVYGAYDLAGQQPFPSLADGFYLGSYPLMFAGLLVLPMATGRRELLSWRVWSNVAIVILGGGMALLHFVLLPTLNGLSSDAFAGAISVAYPLGDLALLAALGTISARRPFAGDRRALGFCIVAVAAWFFADVAFAIATANGSYAPGDPSDLIYLAADACFLLAAQSQLLSLPRPNAFKPGPALSLGRIGPYVMLAVGMITLVAASLDPRGEMVLLVMLVVALTGLVVVRQVVDEQERRQAEAALLAEQVTAAAEAARQARRDSLTGLPNRASAREILAAETEASRLTGRPLTLVFIDLNQFKSVNDGFGHGSGDALLMEVARRLENSVRADDVVARLGGDEFAIILPGARAEPGREVACRAAAALEQPFTVGRTEIGIGAAFGLATYPDDGASDDDALMHQADTAMYRAKRARLGPTRYDVAFEGSAYGMSDLAELRRAIDGSALRLHFQPVRQRTSGLTVGVEALVRWMHPTRGLLMPGEFIPLATQTGLIGGLDARVLKLACAQTRAWRDEGLAVRTSINVSRDSVQDRRFAALMETTLAECGVPGTAIEVEITEDGIIDKPEEAVRFVDQMRQLGVRTAIDDFGTGFSSLARLRDLRVQCLKIDQSFVRDALKEPKDAAIVEAVIVLARRLGMEVLAEGVEDVPTMAYLDRLGTDYIQGYVNGGPVDAQAITERLASEQGRGLARGVGPRPLAAKARLSVGGAPGGLNG